MPLWGRNDQAVTANSTTTRLTSNGAPIGTSMLVNAGGGPNAHFGNTSGTRALADSTLFQNTTPGAFVAGKAVGVFGVDTTEMGVASGGLFQGSVTNPGSGYTANATITLTVVQGGSSGVANAQANSTGKIAAINISTAGSGYVKPPILTVAAPTAQTFFANTTAVTGGTPATGANGTILLATAGAFVAGDPINYTVAAGNTAISPLVSGTRYFVQFANATAVALTTTPGGSRLVLVPGGNEGGHTLQGDRATGAAVVGGAKNNGAAHAGWNLVTIGTGGRAGRVQYETLVAMGSLGAQTASFGTPALVADASDDTILPDS